MSSTSMPVRSRRRRLRTVSGVLVALIAGAALPLLVKPVPAAAAAICPGGTYATASAAINPGTFICMGYDGKARGGITKGGLYTKTIPGLSATMAPKLNQPSSVLSAAGGGPPTNNANLAGVNGNPAAPTPGKLSLGTRVLQNGTAIVSAGLLGYSVGNQLAQMGCSFGADILCTPTKNTAVAPNADVSVSVSPGWSTQTLTADSTAQENDYQGQPNHIVGTIGWKSAPPSLGSTPTAGTVQAALQYQVTTSAAYGSAYTGFSQMQAVCRNPWTSSFNAGSRGPNDLLFDGSGASFTAYIPYRQPAGGPYSLTISLATGSTDRVLCAGRGGVEGFYQGPLNSGGVPTTKIPLVTWFAPGSTYAPPVQSSNPKRKLTTTNTCERPDGTTFTTSGDSRSFFETDPDYPEIPLASPCPSGSVLAGSKTIETGDGVPPKTVVDVPVPQKIKDAQKAYPECLGGDCRLTLLRIAPADGDLGDCFAKVGRCAGWFTDPSKTQNFKCTYGLASAPHDVPLSECTVYKPTFDRAADPTKAPYGDPDTGNDPGTDTGNGDSDPVVDPLPGDLGGADCFPSGFGVFNPVNWVLQPIKCALVWAFVPSDGVLDGISTSLRTKLDQSGWGAWVSAIGGIFGSLTTGNGCEGPTFKFKFGPVDVDGHPLSACAQPMSTAAAMSRALTTVFVIIFGGMACLRALGAGFGFDVSIGRGARAPGEGGAA